MNAELHYRNEQRRNRRILLLLFMLLLLLSVLFLFAGRYPKGGITFPSDLRTNMMMQTIMLNVRLPRIVLALIAGAILSAAG
ncbi:MAG TPA: iron ABC transporter permease, partial [Sphaerochaeta sp.]|nr:iron ABC transporter permease [Sphaerochaeta sp.]